MTERFWSKVAVAGPDDCWYWRACRAKGYGRFGIGQRVVDAHRASYEMHFGPIPAGLVIDHACHNRDLSCIGGRGCAHRACVNPAHLEAVTQGENIRRSHRRGSPWRREMTHCLRGHPLSGTNLRVDPKSGTRICRSCSRIRDELRRRARGVRARNFTQSSTRLDTKALRDRLPRVAERFSTTTESRVLRITAHKETA